MPEEKDSILLANKVVLVTGGAGAVGSSLVAELIRLNNRVIVVDSLDSGYRHKILENTNCVFIEGNIIDENVLEKAFSYSPKIVFHLAAFFANQRSVDYPELDLETNGKGTLKLLQFSLKNKIERFIYASSSCVYGHKEGEMIETDFNFELETPYAITKLLGEYYTTYFNRMYNLPTVILRYFNSYGPGDFPGKYKGVIPNFIKSALEGRSMIITGTGEESRSFTYVKDIVRGTILASVNLAATGEIFNIGSEEEIKIFELAKKIKSLTGSRSQIEFVERRKWDRIEKRTASTEKAKNILGYTPKYGFEEGLKLTIDWMKRELEAKNTF